MPTQSGPSDAQKKADVDHASQQAVWLTRNQWDEVLEILEEHAEDSLLRPAIHYQVNR